MNKLSYLGAAMLVAWSATSMSGQQLSRQSVSQSAQESQPVVPEAFSRIKGMKFDGINSRNLPAPIVQSVSTAKVRHGVIDRKDAPMARANAAGSIQGFLGYHRSMYSTPNGWYNVKTPSSSLIWKQENYYPLCGYIRDGKLTTWYSLSSTSEGLYEFGMKVFNVQTGVLEEQQTFNLFDEFDHLAWSCAYDQEADLVYLVTSRIGDVNKYQTTIYDPKTGSYTRVGDVADADWPLAMNWSPEDGNVYSLLEDGSLRRLDKKKGNFTLAASSGHEVSEYAGSMVYSPKDHGFVYMLSSYDNPDITEMGVVTLSGSYSILGTTSDDEQWSILHTDDPYASANAPAMASLETWSFSGASLNGSVTLKMPVVKNNGNQISGTMFLEVTVDGQTPVYDRSVTPGASVNVPLNLTEGLHTIVARPYVYSGIDKDYAAPLRIIRYAGNDAPKAPTDVRLTKNQVSWTAPGAIGANEGFVATAQLRYNVYINGTKMNSEPIAGTSYNITLPGDAALYVAEVEATANGKTSARGTSNTLAADGPLEIPFYLGPADGEQDMTQEMIDMFTIVNSNGDDRAWQYDRQNPFTGGFYYLDNSELPADDWLLLPAANFTSSADVYKLSFEVWSGYHYFTDTERFEVGISPDKNVANMKIISPAQELEKLENFTPVEVLFSVDQPGAKYIGIHCISDPDAYRLYARNFRVTRTQSSMSAPAAVSNLSVTPSADGRLLADVSFTMPATDLTGAPLPDGTQVTATVATSADSKSVTAAAGSNASVQVGAVQGTNTFVVTTSTSSGEGATASIEQFVGVDLPGKVDIQKSITADNKSMTMTWDISNKGANGGAVIPGDCTYKLMRYNGQGWVEYKNLGNATSYTYTHTGNSQEIVQFGVLACNAAGESPSYTTVGEILGSPYGLPMHETWPYEGEEVKTVYDPYMIQGLTELSPTWGFADPSDLADQGVTPNDSGIALVSYWIGMSQFTLPKFSTKGMNNVKLDLSAFFGATTPSFNIVGRVADQEDIILGEFNQSSGSGWENITVSLPAMMQNRDWVSISIVVNITSYSQYFLLDGYKISNYPGNDVAVSSLKGDVNGNIGTQLNFKAGVLNMGENAVAMPAATVQILRGSEVIRQFTPEIPSGQLGKAHEAEYAFSFIPTADMLGSSVMRFSIESDDAMLSNNSMDVDLNFHNSNVPVPQNLTGTGTAEGASLQWDEPAIVFGAEESIDGEYGETIGRFRNLDRDGLVPYALTGINYPDRAEPKGFQVLPVEAISQLVPLVEGAGERVLFTLASSKGVQDNWLISPQVKGGTDVSFRIACASFCDDNEYLTESIELLASSTTDDPAAFTKVAEFSNKEVKWIDCKATLPADAKYFALRYAGVQNNFCLFIDAITYMPVAYDGSIVGYNVYKSGAESTMVEQRSWFDADYTGERPAAYNVRTMMNLAGANVESEPSDALILYPSSVDEISGADRRVVAGRGYIEVRGMQGRNLTVAATDGRVVARAASISDCHRINLPQGIYVVVCGDGRYKVVVR